MAHFVTVFTHVVSDATHAWVTRESSTNVSILSFWYNPDAAGTLTMYDVVDTIEKTLGGRSQINIGYVTVRGYVIQRQDLANYKATEYLKDNESFNCHSVARCCTLL